MLKNTTDARVLPGSTASTASPSRTRVVGNVLHFLLPLHPAVARRRCTTLSSSTMKSSAVYSASPASLADRRAARVAVLLLDLLDLDAHDVPPALLVLQQRVDLPRAAALLLELLADDQDLEPRQAIDLQLEDRVGLLGVELEARDDLLRPRPPCLPTCGRSSGSRRARRRPSRSPRGCGRASCSASSSCSSRLVTTSRRKWRKCQSIACRSSRSGRPTSGFSVGIRQVRLTMKLVCSGVCLNRYAITIFSSASLLQLERDADVVGRQVLDVDERRQLAARATTSAMRSTSVRLVRPCRGRW